jgi:putative inorganic carbon (HCO3(-)) transporter
VNALASPFGVWRKPVLLLDRTLHPLAVLAVVVLAGLALATLPLSWAAGLILAAAASLLILLRPVAGLYLLVLAIPFGSLREISVGVISIGGAETLAALIAASWLLAMLARRELRTVRAPLLVPMIILLAVMAFSVEGALSLQWSIKGLLVWVELIAVYLLVVNLVDPKQARYLIALVLVAGILEALLGIYQFFGRVGPEGFLLFDRFMRAYGTFQQPNPFGGYLAMILPLSLTIFLAHWRRVDRWNVALRGLAAAGILLMGAALLMSWSRGAWLAFAGAAAVVLLLGVWYRAFGQITAGILTGVAAALLCEWWLLEAGLWWAVAPALGALVGIGVGVMVFSSLSRRWWWLLSSVFLLLLTMLATLGGQALLPESITQRFSDLLPYLRPTDVTGVHVTDENFAVVERLAHWQAAGGMVSDHPLLGVGIGNYVPVYPAYAVPGWKDPLGHAHNYYLNMAAEAGLLGLGAYLLFLLACFRHGWSATRSLVGLHQAVALGILGVLTAFAVHSLFDNLYVHGMNMHLATLLGLVFVVARRGEERLVAVI